MIAPSMEVPPLERYRFKINSECAWATWAGLSSEASGAPSFLKISAIEARTPSTWLRSSRASESSRLGVSSAVRSC